MMLKRSLASVWVGIGLVCLMISAGVQNAGAQSAEKYKVRLAPAPALNSKGAGITLTAANVVGLGNATATLSGKKLTVAGSFENLASSATAAHLYLGPAMGARNYGGSPLFDVTVMKAADGKSGTLSGSFDLSADQIDALKKGRIYLQLHSEGAPSGHLVGWLVK